MKCRTNVALLAVAVLSVVARLSWAQIDLPDVIIGDPNDASNDILGEPISEKELKASMTIPTTKSSEDEDDAIYQSQYFEGDIVVNSTDQLFQILEGDPNDQLSAVKNPRMTWPSGIIPYVISASFASWERSIIARSMAEYRAKTCIQFVPRTARHFDYVHILKGQGCSSAVGRVGGVQVLSLGNNCVHFGIVIHEMMHAAGFWHEQSRSDRDSFVTINWANILPGLAYNFRKKSTSTTVDLGLAYDYSSIMHYGAYAFSRSRSYPTIVPRRSGANIGQRTGFSQMDIRGLNLLYRCTGTTTKPKPGPTTCADKNENCASWATQGYCTSSAQFMEANCKKSCNKCGGTECQDQADHCVSWAAQGECQHNPGFMKISCRRSCNLCGKSGACQDKNEHCQYWSGKGECTNNPGFMQIYCKKSCDMC